MKEFLFPFASVVKVDPNKVPRWLGPSLVVTAITRDPKLIQAFVASPRIVTGPYPNEFELMTPMPRLGPYAEMGDGAHVQLEASLAYPVAAALLGRVLIGREFQQEDGKEGQVVIVTPLLVGTDGHVKMSKSKGNYIAVTDPPGGQSGIRSNASSINQR